MTLRNKADLRFSGSESFFLLFFWMTQLSLLERKNVNKINPLENKKESCLVLDTTEGHVA
jgi:hypothetical protein